MSADAVSAAAQCHNCEHELEGGENFCPQCGEEVRPGCPACGHELGGEENVCPECGTELAAE
ncbi:zinc-ribbon domain-containing protein [Halobellus sp.]|uniref:zinc-ribbon domain-containing protein n=1 Tax=Halobellus sp. TaxID=1979212 RepID=UPI0035D4EF3C